MSSVVYVEARLGNFGMEHKEAITLLESMGYRWVKPVFNNNGVLLEKTGEWSLTKGGLTLQEDRDLFDRDLNNRIENLKLGRENL